MLAVNFHLDYSKVTFVWKALPSAIVPPKPLCQHLAWKRLIALSVIYFSLSPTTLSLGIFLLNECLYQKSWHSNFLEMKFLPVSFPPSPQNWEAETHEISTWSFQCFNSESFQCGALRRLPTYRISLCKGKEPLQLFPLFTFYSEPVGNIWVFCLQALGQILSCTMLQTPFFAYVKSQ